MRLASRLVCFVLVTCCVHVPPVTLLFPSSPGSSPYSPPEDDGEDEPYDPEYGLDSPVGMATAGKTDVKVCLKMCDRYSCVCNYSKLQLRKRFSLWMSPVIHYKCIGKQLTE